MLRACPCSDWRLDKHRWRKPTHVLKILTSPRVALRSDTNNFVTQRQEPRMALITPLLPSARDGALVLTFPGRDSVEVGPSQSFAKLRKASRRPK